MRVAAFTSGPLVPSTRFRVRQYVSALAARGIIVTEHPSRPNKYTGRPVFLPDALWTAMLSASRIPGLVSARTADVIWLEREFVWRHRTLEHLAGPAHRRIFDVDDAIWLGGVQDFAERIASECAGVIAGNAYIADHFRHVARRVWVVPTSVDHHRWAPPERPAVRDRYVVGWTGTSGNFKYLYAIEPGLDAFVRAHPDVDVLVVADRPPAWQTIPSARARFIPWSEAHEVSAVHGMDVGLMPLADEAWARGKCAAKMLVYMAAGLPVVVSPVGVNQEVLATGSVGYAATTPAEWTASLETLYQHRDEGRAMGARGRAVVAAGYSVEACATQLAEIFHAVAQG